MSESGITPGKIAWNKFKRNPLALAGFFIILLVVIIAFLGYLLCPDSTPNANTQHLELSGKKPGFNTNFLLVRKNEIFEKRNFFSKMFHGQASEFEEIPFLDFTFNDTEIILREYTDFPEKEEFYRSIPLVDVVYAIEPGRKTETSGINSSVEYLAMDGVILNPQIEDLKQIIQQSHVINKTFYLGTDRFGRDLLSRIILGARISLLVGFIAVCISLLIGISMGAIAGYYRGKVDGFIMWIINVIWSIPTLLLVIALTMVIGKGFWQVFVAVGITMWVEVARVVRGQVLSLREKEFIEAAKVLGYSDLRIILKHIIPNIMSPVIIISAANFASAILIEAGLSFLGIGVQPPVASWGGMVKDHYGFILAGKAYLAFIPGFAIMIMVLAFTMLGNGLRDAFDIRKE